LCFRRGHGRERDGYERKRNLLNNWIKDNMHVIAPSRASSPCSLICLPCGCRRRLFFQLEERAVTDEYELLSPLSSIRIRQLLNQDSQQSLVQEVTHSPVISCSPQSPALSSTQRLYDRKRHFGDQFLLTASAPVLPLKWIPFSCPAFDRMRWCMDEVTQGDGVCSHSHKCGCSVWVVVSELATD